MQGGNYRQRPYSRRGRGPWFWIILAFIIFSLISGGSRFSNSFGYGNGPDFGHNPFNQQQVVAQTYDYTVNGQATIVINDPTFEEQGNRLIAVAEAAPKGAELRAVIVHYLGAKHLNSPGAGCPLAALAAEIARQPLEVRKRIHQSMLAHRERMLPYIPGATVEESAAAPSFCSLEWRAQSSPPGR